MLLLLRPLVKMLYLKKLSSYPFKALYIRQILDMKTLHHTFRASLSQDAKWKPGLREFFEYRDLGINTATNGSFNAHVIRVKKPAGTFPRTGIHLHELDFQMIYVLKGWIKFIYKDHGEFRFSEGDCCLQPPNIIHNELECSDDLELIEITSPATFKTKVAKF